MDSTRPTERIFEFGVGLGRQCQAALKQLDVTATGQDLYRRATLFFFNKAFRTYGAIQLLDRENFLEDGVVLGRTLFELNMQAEWMSRDPDARAQQFFDHFPVRFYDLHQQKKEAAARMNDGEILTMLSSFESSPGLQAKKVAQDSLRNKFLTKRRGQLVVSEYWWCGSIYDLAKWLDKEIIERGEPNADYEWLYNFVYFQESELAHTGTTSLPPYDVVPGEPDASSRLKQGLDLAHSSTARFVRTADIMQLAWNLALTDEILKARDLTEQIYSTTYPNG
jgi:hypothetical protein